MSFSFEKGKAIAAISDGKEMDILCYDMNSEAPKVPLEQIVKELYKRQEEGRFETKDYLKGGDLERLLEALSLNMTPKSGKLNILYEDARAIEQELSGKAIYNKDIKVTPFFEREEDQTARITAFGPPGAGKSTILNKILKVECMMYPDTKIYVFSRLREDKSLDEGLEERMYRIPIDETIMEMDIENMGIEENAYVVFDDITSITNDKWRKQVIKIRDTLLEVGRHGKINIMIVNHTTRGGAATSKIHSCSTGYIVFPQAGINPQYESMLETYGGLSKGQIRRILNLRSRWVLISKNAPRYVLYENGGYLLK